MRMSGSQERRQPRQEYAAVTNSAGLSEIDIDGDRHATPRSRLIHSFWNRLHRLDRQSGADEGEFDQSSTTGGAAVGVVVVIQRGAGGHVVQVRPDAFPYFHARGNAPFEILAPTHGIDGCPATALAKKIIAVVEIAA